MANEEDGSSSTTGLTDEQRKRLKALLDASVKEVVDDAIGRLGPELTAALVERGIAALEKMRNGDGTKE